MKLGTEVELGPGDIVLGLDGDPSLPQRVTVSHNFRPMSLVAKRLDG